MLNLPFLNWIPVVFKILNQTYVEPEGILIVLLNLISHTTSLRIFQLVPAWLVTLVWYTEPPSILEVVRARIRLRAIDRCTKDIGTSATTCTIVTITLAVFIHAIRSINYEEQNYKRHYCNIETRLLLL